MNKLELNKSLPIGVFDSGVGGLSVLIHLQRLLPNEQFIYLSDSAFAPYGERTVADVNSRCESIANFLKPQCKALVIACNTATSMSASSLRQRWSDWPIIGMEPGLKPALAKSQNKRIGVLATTGTLKGQKYQTLKHQLTHASTLESQQLRPEKVKQNDFKHSSQAIDANTVFEQACPGLVEVIESNNATAQKKLLSVYLQPLTDANVDVIVFGCTHYPFMRPLAENMAPNITFIDTGFAVATHLKNSLTKLNLLSDQSHNQSTKPTHRYLTTGDLNQFNSVANHLLSASAPELSQAPLNAALVTL